MSELQIVVLAIVQGLTEFLPISSSGHLILSPYLFGFADQGLAFDVAVHLGSLTAVLGYFRNDVWQIATGWLRSLGPGRTDLAKAVSAGPSLWPPCRWWWLAWHSNR